MRPMSGNGYHRVKSEKKKKTYTKEEVVAFAQLAFNYMLESNPEVYGMPISNQKAVKDLGKNVKKYVDNVDGEEALAAVRNFLD